MKRSNRLRWLGAIALAVIILITLIAAPSANKLNPGSTYSRSPNGYGAWYAFMQQRGTPVQRWQKPFSDLSEFQRSITLLRINSQLSRPKLSRQERQWVEKGHTLAVLGVWGGVTAAEFSTMQPSPVGSIKIETRRRSWQAVDRNTALGDRFGAIVWREQIGKGKAIFATTPYLAANAYQDYLNNYVFLAELLKDSQNPIWVDEYIHGYKDSASSKSPSAKGSPSGSSSDFEQGWASYLAQTPIFPALLQASILLLVLIWAHNQRFGSPIAVNPPAVDNSQAYIQALAEVLQKAESSEFVVDTVGKAEQMQLQQALGLGTVPVEHPTLINAWVEKTGRPASELEQLLRRSQKRHMSDQDLLNWLEKWQTVRSRSRSI